MSGLDVIDNITLTIPLGIWKCPRRSRQATPPLIRFRNVVKRFGGVAALRGVSLDLHAGEILALLGENGAGKSTLIKTLGGIVEPTEGSIEYRGERYRHRPPRFGEHQPVAFIHQDLGLVEWMTIAENIALATGYPRRRGHIDWRAVEAATESALAQVDCPLAPTLRVRDLTRTEKSLVAIARALSVQADVLVLDEPSASLPADEVHRLFDALRPLKARGVGMIYVSHRLDEVFEIADRIAVLARRSAGRRKARRGHDPGGAGFPDRRKGARQVRGHAAPAFGEDAARRVGPDGRRRRPGRFHRCAIRDRRPRRPARRRTGTYRPGAVRRAPAFGNHSARRRRAGARQPRRGDAGGDRTHRPRPRRRIRKPAASPFARTSSSTRTRSVADSLRRFRRARRPSRPVRSASRSAFVRTTPSCRSNRSRAATSRR